MSALQAELETLRAALATCGPNARAILVRQAQRLTEGAKRYGDDFDDGRDWLVELIAELSDGENYADRIALAGKLTPRLAVVRALLSDAHRLAQAELAERAPNREHDD